MVDIEKTARAVAHNTLYKRLYGADTLSSRLDEFRSLGPSELAAVVAQAAELVVEALDFSDPEQLAADEEKLRKHEQFLMYQSDLLPWQVYTVRDLALKLRWECEGRSAEPVSHPEESYQDKDQYDDPAWCYECNHDIAFCECKCDTCGKGPFECTCMDCHCNKGEHSRCCPPA